MRKSIAPVPLSSVNCSLQINGNRAFISGTYPLDFVREVTSYFVDGYEFSPQYKKRIFDPLLGHYRRVWDGRCHLFDIRTRSMPAGLARVVVRELREADPRSRIQVIDDRVAPPSAYDISGFQLRGIDFGAGKYDYQLEAAKAAIDARQCILKMATNAGKTEVASAITQYLKIGTLFTVPGVDLMYQTRERFALRLNLDVEDVGLIGDQEFKIGRWITVATVDSLSARMQDTPELLEAMRGFWQLLFVDECHTAGSDTFYDVLDAIQAYYRIGLSGTPLDRGDGANLRLIAQTGDVAYEVTNKLLIERGISVPVEVQFKKIAEPKVSGDHYKTVQRVAVQTNESLNGDIERWVIERLAEGLQVVVFVREIQHGAQIEKRLTTKCKYPIKFLNGQEDTQVRRDSLRAFTKGDLQCIIATSILYQGIDTPAIDVIVFADIGKSKIAAMQAIGRGLRNRAATENRPAKTKLILRDYANFCHKWFTKHSLARLNMYKAEKCFNLTVAA